MAKKFEDMKLKDFLSALGSKNGAPGGGAAAALTGACGAGLVEMVSRLNDSRKGTVSPAAARLSGVRKKLQALISKDAQAFGRIHALYKVRQEKKAAWQSALKAGAKPPLEIGGLCIEAARLSKNEKPRTSAWLQSDLREALILLEAAYRGAKLNVEINLKEINDAAFLKPTRRKLDEWKKQWQKF